MHVPVLDPAHGAAAVRVAVARALGPEATAAGRRRPELRTAVARSLSQSAAREAGVMAAVGLVAGNTYAQARLTQRLAAVSGREMGAERIPEVVVAMCAGTASAILARQATRAIGPGWLVRAGVSYATTLLVADATARWLERGGAAAERPLSALRALVESRAGRDGGGDGASGPPPDPMETVRAALARVRGRGRG